MDHESGELSGPVALYDFVYLDYDKVESYSAQLDPAGSLRETKVVKQTVHTAGSAGEVGIPKLASGLRATVAMVLRTVRLELRRGPFKLRATMFVRNSLG